MVHRSLPTDGAKSVSGTSCALLKMTWDESSGFHDGTCRSTVGLHSLVETAKKAPPIYGPGNASPTVKLNEGPREINATKREADESQLCQSANPFPKVVT